MNSRKRIHGMFLILSLAFITAGCATKPEHSSPEEFIEYVSRVEAAADKVIGDEMPKQTKTLVIPVTWEDADGNDVIYRIIQTTYYNADPAEVTGLNVDAIKEIIDPDEAESSRDCRINDDPGAWYEKDNRVYLCWTDTPEYSFVLEYSPGTLTEDEAVKMAESVLPAEGKCVSP